MSDDASTVSLAPIEAAILLQGRRIAVPAEGLTLGRDGADVAVDSERASRRHARIEPVGDDCVIADLGSTNGTYVNGDRIAGPCVLRSGDTIRIGATTLHFVCGAATRAARHDDPPRETHVLRMDRERLSIGRDEAGDVVLDDPNVSRVHAEVCRRGERLELRDLGSTNGTFVDGVRATGPVALGRRAQIRIGPFRLVVEGDTLVARDERGQMRLSARAVSKRVKDKQILQPTTLTIEPGRFVAIIGESGAGKTTLMKALAGIEPASAGTVTINGEDLAAHRLSIGYVPQQEITHDRLTVLEALTYGARLRLPGDSTASDVHAACARVLEELSLTEHAGTRVDRLSGGQRRRTGVAMELLSRPSLVFLDEPTTGLDPGLEVRMMAMLRDLASGGSRAVVLVTHATGSLELCDEVVVMGRGGVLVFQGAPSEALRFFAAQRFEQIYARLDEVPAVEWQRRFQATGGAAPGQEPSPPPAAGTAATRAALRPIAAQVNVLAARYARLFVRDRRNALILIAQVPLIALALGGLFKPDVFASTGSTADAAQLLFLLVTVTIWLGAIDAAREVVKERSVLQREAAVGVRPIAYLISKLIVLWGLMIVQIGALVAITLWLRPLHDQPAAYVALIGTLALTGFVSVAVGLVVSSAAGSNDQATSFVPLVLIPQLFFAGAIIPEPKMSEPIRALSGLVYAKWSFATSGASIDLDERLLTQPGRARRLFGDFFDMSLAGGLGILVVFLAASLMVAWALVRRLSAAGH
jgi:ABC-type multidrug transport system ATPase subunit